MQFREKFFCFVQFFWFFYQRKWEWGNKNLRHVLVNMELIKREFIVIHDIEKRANHSIPRTQYAVVIKHPRNLSFRAQKLSHSFKRKKNLLKKNKIILKTTHKKVFSFFLAFFFCVKQLHLRSNYSFWFVKKRTISPLHLRLPLNSSFVECPDSLRAMEKIRKFSYKRNRRCRGNY